MNLIDANSVGRPQLRPTGADGHPDRDTGVSHVSPVPGALAGRAVRNSRVTRGTVPLLALVSFAVALRPVLPAWAAMWAIALAVFFGCKWLTWRSEAPAHLRGSLRRILSYLFLWTGMDPAAFLRRTRRRDVSSRRQWVAPLARVVLGVALISGVARLMLFANPLLAGWAGMVGLVLLLHFGVFDLIASAWRSRGYDAEPLMNAPMRSAGLSDFWSNRWNTACNHLAGRYVFAPLSRRIGLTGATLATFLASGLVHDLVISVPSRAGYGRPTAYVLIQGVGVLLERAVQRRGRTRQAAGAAQGGTTGAEPRFHRRRPTERNPGLRSCLAAPAARAWARFLAAIVIIAPLPLLFHEPFVVHVILPFLDAIGAM